MAMFAPIPLPGNNDAFKDVMDYFEQLQNRKMKQPLISAQTKEATANAAKAQMIASLIQTAFGGGGLPGTGGQGGGSPGMQGGGDSSGYAYDAQGNNIKASPEEVARIANGGGYNPTPEEQSKIQGMQPGESLVLGQGQGGQGLPDMSSGAPTQPAPQVGAGGRQQAALGMLQALGILKETPQQQEEREKRTAYQKELGASDVKQIEKWNDIITSNSQITPVLENIQEAAANPTFQAMYKNPEYFGYDIAYLKRFGTDEQKDLLNSVGTNAKSIFQAMGQEFKGAFREFELNLFNKAAPDEIRDTLQGIVSKTNTMMALRNLMTKRLTLANNIVRQSGGQISPANALEIADRQVNGKQIRQEIQDKFNKSQAEQKAALQNRTGKNASNPNAVSAEVEIYSPQGKLVARGSKDQAAKFLSEHRGYYQKVLSNGQ